MLTIYYLLDKREPYKRSKSTPIIADVKYHHGNQRRHFRFSTGLTCNPKNFHLQQLHGRESNADIKNLMLRRIKEKAEGIYHTGLSRGELPDPQTFKNRLKDALKEAETEKTTLDYLDAYIAHIESKKKSKSFISAMKKLKEVLKELNDKGVSLRFQDITLDFETKYRQHLNDRGYGVNTVSSYVKRLKMFLNWSSKNNLNQNQNYKLFELHHESREIIALSETEVEAIANLPIPKHKHIETGGTKLIRDWLIISTQTALRYSDFPKVAAPKLVPVTGGYDIHVNRTQKTKENVVIPVSRLLYKILKQYDFNVPLPPSNQKFNAGLKRIAGLAKIDKPISSHTGRKTFCTTNYRRGVPVAQIMKISGHKTEKEFYKYIGVSLSENAALVRSTSQEFIIEAEETKMVVNK